MVQAIIGRKLGMGQVFAESGEAEAVTAIEAGPCVVTQVKTEAKEGYKAAQLGFGQAKRLNSPRKGHLKKLGQFEYLREFRVADTEEKKSYDLISISTPAGRLRLTATVPLALSGRLLPRVECLRGSVWRDIWVLTG